MQLVHLDRVDATVLVTVARLGDRVAKRFVDAAYLRPQHILEPDQERELHTAAAQLRHDLDHVHRRAVLVERADADVTLLVDEEIRLAPALDAIELDGVGNGPLGGRVLFLRL